MGTRKGSKRGQNDPFWGLLGVPGEGGGRGPILGLYWLLGFGGGAKRSREEKANMKTFFMFSFLLSFDLCSAFVSWDCLGDLLLANGASRT